MSVWVDDPFSYLGSGASAVSSPTIYFTPQAAWTTSQRISIYRGSGVPITFAQSGTVVAIDPTSYEAKIGVPGTSSPYEYSIALGNLSEGVDGSIIIDVTAAETSMFSLSDAVVIELWRIDTDNTKTVVGKASITVLPANNN